MTTHCCVNKLPVADWRRTLANQEDHEIQSWISQVQPGSSSRSLLKSTYYRTYYRLCRQEMARRGVRS